MTDQTDRGVPSRGTPMGRRKRRVGRRHRLRQLWGYRFADVRYRLRRALGLARPRLRLAACMCFKNASTYLEEWIEFHRLVGVEHFFLYNNNSEDEFMSVLRPYIDRGLVTFHDWPGHRQQLEIYDHCIRTHGPLARWIAFIDDDEFLFPVEEGVTLPVVLEDYADYAGVLVNRALFGSSGHLSRPPGGVIENFVMCAEDHVSNLGKSIVRPERALCFRNPHAIEPRPGHHVVDENFLVCAGSRKSMSPTPTSRRLRVNHYECKSEEELQSKMARGDAVKGVRHAYSPYTRRAKRIQKANALRNTDILRYLPRLREALAHRDNGQHG